MKIQIWIVISIYVPVAIMKKRLHLNLELYTILQILSVTFAEDEIAIEAFLSGRIGFTMISEVMFKTMNILSGFTEDGPEEIIGFDIK